MLMDPDLAWERQHFLEIGTFFNVCPAPFSRTKILMFVPRYILINKLDYPIVIKERNGIDQIVLKPNSQKYFNIGLERDSSIMIRAIDSEKEVRSIQNLVPIQSESNPIEIQSLPRQTITEGLPSGEANPVDTVQKSSRKRVTET